MQVTFDKPVSKVDKIISKTISSKMTVHTLVTSCIGFTPDMQTEEKLRKGLALVEAALQTTATFHSKRKHSLQSKG